jgi:porin
VARPVAEETTEIMTTYRRRISMRFSVNALLILSALWVTEHAVAQHAETPETSLGTGLLTGPRWSAQPLTGDWFGVRSRLAESGLTFGINVVDTFQGVLDGGRDEDWDNGGSIYIESLFDTEKAGLWAGGFLEFRAEKQYGTFANNEAGALVNMVGLFPEPDKSSLVVSKLLATQFVSPRLAFLIGRTDTLDGDTNNLTSGRGRTGFLRPELSFSPNSILTTPYVINAVGALIVAPNPFMERPSTLSLVFADPGVQPTDSGLDSDFFEEQYYAAEWRVPTFFMDLPGSQNVSYNYNTKEFLRLDKLTESFITGTRSADSGAGVFAYNFHQYFYVKPGQDTANTGYDADKPRLQGVGVFGRVGYSDGDVNPLNWTFSLGLAGRGLLSGRPDDTFGVAGYYIKYSDSVADEADAISDNSVGMEAYYNIAVTPWLHVTPDFQVFDPFLADLDVTWVAGLRMKVDL